VAVEGSGKFCTACGAELPAADKPAVVLAVETGRRHVQNHACQLRFRAVNMAPTAQDVTLRAVLYGRERHLEQEERDLEQFGRLLKREEQITFTFPFRPLIPGEFPVQTLQMVASPAGRPGESRVYEIPDRSLFVEVADPQEQRSGPGITISGGIHVDFSQLKELYGSDIDIKNLLALPVDREPPPAAAQPPWEPILLRFVGTQKRATCGFAGCARPILVREGFSCQRCQAAMCRAHRDDDKPAYCKLCAETARAEQFAQATQGSGLPTRTHEARQAMDRISQAHPAFAGRIWTERSIRPTTRELTTVPRESKDCFQIGEDFALHVQADRDCYLTLLDFGTSGNMYVLLANYPLHGGRVTQLSGPDQGHRWVVGPPAGSELLKAVFTLQAVNLFSGGGALTPLSPQGQHLDASQMERAAQALKRMPLDSWTDASCEFAVLAAGS
jgi:hypothetical protein